MTQTTLTATSGSSLLGSPRKVLKLMAAVVAVSAAIALGPMTSQEPTAVPAAFDGRVDYAIRHMGEGSVADANARNVDYALRHMAPASVHRVDYALRHPGE